MKLEILETEQRNKKSTHIDSMDTKSILQLINEEDQTVALAVKKCIPQITKLIDACFERILTGGRIIYIGAGTSGRLGVLDASECPPTFGVPFELFQGLIAGGNDALLKAKEGAEDNRELGKADRIKHSV